MDHKDYYWGLYRDYYMDPFLHSLLSTREWFRVESVLRLWVGTAAMRPMPQVMVFFRV